MICPNCGWDATNMRKTCEYCGPFVAKSEPTIPHSGLEKIEPLEGGLTVIDKLNEVIEKVNLLIDLQNKGVK